MGSVSHWDVSSPISTLMTLNQACPLQGSWAPGGPDTVTSDWFMVGEDWICGWKIMLRRLRQEQGALHLYDSSVKDAR